MSHQAIYRKFRPKTFDDVLGQNHVTQTIKNQIMTGNTAHAYIFNGIRGTGKTSIAKIFSRAINCLNNTDGNPCNECEICKATLNETNMDVIEMDAASNNSVEDIRDLRDKVKFMPVSSKYKVYIIDEVHMLSKGAFNALLKTLEEPPEHLLFILATTEPHKIPATILSRCQRFDFKRHTVSNIVKNMENICSKLDIKIEEKALKLIAGNSEGAMRDALSILDRCITFGYEEITYETVLSLLGSVNYETIINISDAIIEKNMKEVLTYVDNILNQGKELILFIEDLITHFRNLLVIKTTNSNNNILKIIDETIEAIKTQSNKLGVNEIIFYIEELSETQLECKRALNPRILLEAKLIKMIEVSKVNDISGLLRRIEALESKINNTVIPVKNKAAKKTEIKKQEKNNNIQKEKEKEPESEIYNNKEKEITDVVKDSTTSNGNETERLLSEWNNILNALKREKISLHAILRESNPVKIEDNTAIFEFDIKFKFHMAAAEKENNKNSFKEILNNYLGTNYEIRFVQEKEEVKKDEKDIDQEMEKKAKETFGDLLEIEE